MISLLGPPPLKFLQRCGEKADQYWDRNGKRDSIVVPAVDLWPDFNNDVSAN